MLSKQVCQKCYAYHGKEWGGVEEMFWNGASSLYKQGEKTPCVYCIAAVDDKYNVRAIPLDMGIPKDCPYGEDHVIGE
jgi:hypothetical protein